MKGCTGCLVAVLLVTSTGAHSQEVVARHTSDFTLRASPRLLSLNFKQVQVAVLLQFIADKGGIDVVIAENVTGVLPGVQLTDQTPEQCLQWVAKAAGLRLIKLNGLNRKTFLVDKPATGTNLITRQITLSVNIHEMSLPDAFRAIARKGNVRVFLDDSVQGRVKDFVLNNVEPVEALRRLAFSSGCSFVAIKKMQPDGTQKTECFVAKSRLSFPAKPRPLPDIAPDNFRPETVKPPQEPHAELKIIPPPPNVDPPFSRPLGPPSR